MRGQSWSDQALLEAVRLIEGHLGPGEPRVSALALSVRAEMPRPPVCLCGHLERRHRHRCRDCDCAQFVRARP